VGSGNLIDLRHLVLWDDASYRVEYEYLPVSYQTGTYDLDLNTSRVEKPSTNQPYATGWINQPYATSYNPT